MELPGKIQILIKPTMPRPVGRSVGRLRPHAENRATQCSSTDLDVIIVIGDDGSHNAYVGICIGRDDALSQDRTLMSWRKMGH